MEQLELEVVWDGGELLPPRESNPSEVWTPPIGERRRYVKSGRYAKKPTVAVGYHMPPQDVGGAEGADNG